jgi:hypothetical protein
MDMRRQADAAEAQDKGAEIEEVEDEEAAEEPDAEAEADAEGDDDEEGGKKKKKPAKKKAAPKVKKPAVKRTRVPKEVRQRAFWIVFDNSNKEVEAFPFNDKPGAEALLARKIQEKEGKATFYLNLVKREIKDEVAK